MRRAILLSLLAFGWAAPALAADDPAILAALDAVGPLDGSRYDPGPVIRAVNLLQPIGMDRGTALLRRYVAARRGRLDAAEPSALFVVLRCLYEPPPAAGPAPADACTLTQRDVASGGCIRPPRLGAPQPPAPNDLRSLRYPAFLLGDVPLSLVSGYALGGMPEPLHSYLDALAGVARWRTAPLAPKSTGEVRYLFMHYGQLAFDGPVGRLVEGQLRRIEGSAVRR